MSEEARKHCLEPFFTHEGRAGHRLRIGDGLRYGATARAGICRSRASSAAARRCASCFPAASAAMTASAGTPEPQPLMRRLRVLIVDDDPIVMEALSHSLRGRRPSLSRRPMVGRPALMHLWRPAAAPRAIRISCSRTWGCRMLMAAKLPRRSGRPRQRHRSFCSRVGASAWQAERDVPAEVSRLLSKPPSWASCAPPSPS